MPLLTQNNKADWRFKLLDDIDAVEGQPDILPRPNRARETLGVTDVSSDWRLQLLNQINVEEDIGVDKKKFKNVG